jgi:phosphatidylserine/phosphatidylglycerophosphate/cardiolipin synthase-like enzyme
MVLDRVSDYSAWLLTLDERGNPSTAIDQRHPGAAWTNGNSVTPLVHGHLYYRRLYETLSQTTAGDVVLFTDWRGDPDELLVGPGTAVVDVLEAVARRGVHVKGLLWRSHPDATGFSKEQNRNLADIVNAAGGEVLLDQRVRRAGCHHQKLFVILHPHNPERDVAFVGGIDLCHGRNDDEHHHGDPQAIEVDQRFGPTPAWHDIQAEIRGPAVGDIAETFAERWRDPTPLQRGVEGKARELPIEAPAPSPAGEPGSHVVQVLRTYPAKRPPYPFAQRGERSVARAYEKAFGRARRLIYIEDQYLWSRDIARALGRALASQPELRVVVVVPRYPDQDGRLTGPPNRIGQLIAIRLLERHGGDRFRVYDLDGDEWPIYVHAKVCIIDDVWMTIGSDNLNRRSWTHDSELSCAIIDDTRDDREPADPAGLGDGARVLPRETRMQLWAEHTQQDDLPVDPDVGFDRLASSADALDRWYAQDRVGPRPPGRLRRHQPAPVALLARPLAYVAYRFINDPDGRPLALSVRRQF